MKYLLFIGLLCVAFSANAIPVMEIEGDYSGAEERGLSMKIMVLNDDNEKGVVAVNALIATESCSGSIAGIGNYAGNTLKFSNYTKEAGAENCVVTVNFKNGKKGKKLGTISENESCSYFHGARCAFYGDLIQKLKP